MTTSVPPRPARLPKPLPYREPVAWAEARGVSNRTLWRAWPFMSWLLPVLLFFMIFAGGTGGWEMLFLMLLSPLLLPIYALANLFPRFLMHRVGGYLSSTTLVSVAMIANWWSLILIALSNRGTGDSGSVDSVLGEMFRGVREPLEEQLLVAGVVCLVVSYVVALASAIREAVRGRRLRLRGIAEHAARAGDPAGVDAGVPAVDPADDPAGAGPLPRWRDGSLWVRLAGVAAPALIVLAVAVGITVAGAQATRIMEQQEARWETLQQELAPIRVEISAGDDWFAAGGRAWIDGGSWGKPETSTVTAGWRFVDDAPAPEAEERAVEAVTAAGWVLIPVEVDEQTAARDQSVPGTRVEYEATRDDGMVLSLMVDRHSMYVDASVEDPEEITVTRTEVFLQTPPERVPEDLWINWYERIPAEERDWKIDPDGLPSDEPTRTFAPDEWPSLAKADTTMFR